MRGRALTKIVLLSGLIPLAAIAEDFRAREGRSETIDGTTYYKLSENSGPMFQIRGPAEVAFHIKSQLPTTIFPPKAKTSVLISVDGGRPRSHSVDFAPEVRIAKVKGLSKVLAGSQPIVFSVSGGTHTYELRFGASFTGVVRAEDMSAAPGIPDIAMATPPPALDLPDIPPPPKRAEPALDLPDLPPPPSKRAEPALDLPDLPPPPSKRAEPGLPDLPLDIPAPPPKKTPPGRGGKRDTDIALPDLPPPPPPPKKPPPEKTIVATTVPAPPRPPPAPAPEPPMPGAPPTSGVTVSPEVAMATALEGATGASNAEFALGLGLAYSIGGFRVAARGGARFYDRGYAAPGAASFAFSAPGMRDTEERRYDGGISFGYKILGAETNAATSLELAAGFRATFFDSTFGAHLLGPTGSATLGLALAPNLEVTLGAGYVYNLAGAKGSESILGAPKGATFYSAGIAMRFPPAARVRIGYTGEAMAQQFSNRLTNGMSLSLEIGL